MFELSEIFKSIKEKIIVNGVEHDSRKLKKGQLFIAIKGDNFDGHDFVANAEKIGACAAVVSKKIDAVKMPQIVVTDTIKTYGEIANFWRHKIKYPIIAITGSNGKTTTKEMTYSVISSSLKVNRNGGNLNNHIGVPYSLLQFPLKADCGISEMGMNHLGEIAELSKIAEPNFGLITNVGAAHIGLTGSMENTLKAKTELFNYLRSHRGYISINNNDVLIKKWFKENQKDFKDRYVSFSASIENKNSIDSDVMLSLIESNENGLLVDVVSKDVGKGRVLVPIQGSYNIYNIAASLSVGRCLKIDLQKSLNALSEFIPPDMRSNITEINGAKIFIDCYNANPDSMKVAVDSVSNIKTSGRRIAILGDMLELGDKSVNLHEEIGQYVAKRKFDFVFFVGDLTQNYLNGFKKENSKIKTSEYSKNDIENLKKDLFDLLRAGDVVLIKGSRGMKLERIIGRSK